MYRLAAKVTIQLHTHTLSPKYYEKETQLLKQNIQSRPWNAALASCDSSVLPGAWATKMSQKFPLKEATHYPCCTRRVVHS